MSRIYNSVVSVYRADQGDKSHQDHFRAFKVLTDEVDRVLPFTTDLNEARTQRQQLYVKAYLASLRPEVDFTRSQINVGAEVPTLMEAYFRVIRTSKVVGTDISDTLADRSVMGVVRDGFCGGRGGRRGGQNADHDGERGNVGLDGGRHRTYFNCGQPGHFQLQCPKAYATNVASDAHVEKRYVKMTSETYVKFIEFQAHRNAGASTSGSTAGHSTACVVKPKQ